MKTHWAVNENRAELMLFFCGWGQDPAPLKHLLSEQFDVLLIYDYRTIEPQMIEEQTARYHQVHIVAWSMGVWVANQYFEALLKQAKSTTAINGTCQPIHDQFGIPEAIYQGTLDHFSEKNRDRFFLRMCGGRSGMTSYSAPMRTLEDQQEELDQLQQLVKQQPAKSPLFQRAIVSDQDLIMPTEHQANYWQQFPAVDLKRIEGAHYPFGLWECWDVLVDG